MTCNAHQQCQSLFVAAAVPQRAHTREPCEQGLSQPEGDKVFLVSCLSHWPKQRPLPTRSLGKDSSLPWHGAVCPQRFYGITGRKEDKVFAELHHKVMVFQQEPPPQCWCQEWRFPEQQQWDKPLSAGMARVGSTAGHSISRCLLGRGSTWLPQSLDFYLPRQKNMLCKGGLQ